MADVILMRGPLMTQGAIANMMQRGGARIHLDAASVLRQMTAENNTRPPFLSILCNMAFDAQDSVGSQALGFCAAQACACGYTEQDLPPVREALARYTRAIRARWASVVIAAPDPLEPWCRVLEAGAVDNRPSITVQQLEHFLVRLENNTPNGDINAIRLFTTGLIAFCKRGTISIQYANKINTALRDELNATITIEPNAVSVCWNLINSWFNPAHARLYFEAFEASVGNGCLRLNLAIQQAQWQGMTNYNAIHDAKEKHPDFPWDRLRTMIPEEFTNFITAVAAVAGNPYYGYRRDLGAVKSTNYPNLAYCGVQLLCEVDGQRHFRDFLGRHRNSPRAADIDKMIADYIVTRRAVEPTPEALQAAHEQNEAFRNANRLPLNPEP